MFRFFKLYIIFLLFTNTPCFSNLGTPTLVYPKNSVILYDTISVFKWDKLPESPITYYFEIANDHAFSNVLIQINNISSNQIVINTLPMNKNLYWRVKSFNGTLFSPWSSIWSFGTFTPIFLPNLKLWLKADKGVTKDITNNVSQWNDQSGINNHAFQAISNLQPQFIDSANYLNHFPTIKLDGNDDFLEILTNNTLDFGDSLSGFFVTKRAIVGAHQTLLSKWNYQNDGSFAFQTFWDDPTQFATFIADVPNDPGNNKVISNNANFDDIHYHNIALVFNGNSATSKLSYYNNLTSINSTVTGNIPSALLNSNSNFYIGKFGGLGRNFYGDFPEIVLCKDIFNDSISALLHNYFISKYAPPVNLGENIFSDNFCDTALNASDNFMAYQWSTGATTPTISVNKFGKYWVNATNIFGVTSSDTILVNLPNYNPPIQNIICSGDLLIWNTQLPKSNYTFLWQDGSTTDSVFAITQAGKYYVKINDSFGCSITSDTVKIVEDNFSTTTSLGPDKSLCAGNSIALTTGASPSLTYTWSTGSQNDSLLITTSGQYSVVVTNTNNCVAKDTINVTVLGQAPTANFSSSVGCYNSAVSFTNQSISPSGNTITNTNWNFGDPSSGSNSSTLSNPFHTYSDTGTYFINLNVITDAGCEQTITKKIHIAPTPTVNFTNGLSCQNDSTAFSSSTISSPGYSITSLSWNFGDPGPANTSNLLSPKHLFSNPTTYSVTLVATNNAGCQNSITKPVIVKAQVTASFTNSPPCSNTAVIFQDNSVAPVGSTRLWSFGTNTIGGLTASKTYTSSGVYSVTLSVTGTNFCTSKIIKQIIVFLPPAVNFTIPSFCSKDTITATNQSVAQSGIISSYNWKLNNTTFSAVKNPTLTASAGTYSVKLTVVNSFNCKDSLTKPVTVLPLPIVDFTTNPTAYYFINDPVTFIPTITNASSYLWNITGVPTSTIQSPTVSFNAENSYTVSLNLQDQQGCVNSKTKTILVSKRYLDLAVLNVNTIKDNDGFITVEADVVNYGSVPVTSFDIHYQISDGGNIKEIWNGTLNPNAFYVYTFIAKSATQKNITNNITCVEIEKANGVVDENISNNNLCNTLNNDEISVSNPIPNPTDGDITLPIVLNKDMDFTIAIYNSTGQLVYEETTQKGTSGLNFVTLPTSSYARGCYIIKTIIDDKIFIKKFIKIISK